MDFAKAMAIAHQGEQQKENKEILRPTDSKRSVDAVSKYKGYKQRGRKTPSSSGSS